MEKNMMLKKVELFQQIKGKLIVSCQALPDEPLHSSFIMSKMAIAAKLGGAGGIRSNSVEDIKAIKEVVDLPLIGIIKKVYDESESDVFITPTISEIDLLYKEGVDIIALDATKRKRPNGKTISQIFPHIREKYSNQIFMADCSTYEEAVEAYRLGFDCIGSTLSGYTEYTKDSVLPDINFIKKSVENIPVPFIAEGGIWTEEDLKEVINTGVHAVVIGSAITRPKEITKRFVHVINKTLNT
ncbi:MULTISPECIES: N-acetylmannosamine-6-phosphate 2-epimerase [Bacillus]|uniref:N-acetylmannosamine-6-phosphate 2-epimerase n=1 Tax=Bacillus TaxID=1386 RepID=UPI001E38A733|nr:MULTISPECIES: N-acetylmannosamine-6-phosphate 2-epimerase [Bacillus]